MTSILAYDFHEDLGSCIPTTSSSSYGRGYGTPIVMRLNGSILDISYCWAWFIPNTAQLWSWLYSSGSIYCWPDICNLIGKGHGWRIHCSSQTMRSALCTWLRWFASSLGRSVCTGFNSLDPRSGSLLYWRLSCWWWGWTYPAMILWDQIFGSGKTLGPSLLIGDSYWKLHYWWSSMNPGLEFAFIKIDFIPF